MLQRERHTMGGTGTFRRQRGYTLTELLVSLAISGIVLAPLPMMISHALAAGAASQQEYDLQARVRFAMDRITRRASNTVHADLSPNSSTTTSGSWFSPVTFSLSGTQLMETDSSGSRVIADNVSGFSIALLDRVINRERIAVSLTITDGSGSVTRSEIVQLGGAL